MLKEIQQRIRQYVYIILIRKAMCDTSLVRFLVLNRYKELAAYDFLDNRISREFYISIFLGGDAEKHYSEVNAEKIKNYTYWG